MTRMQKRFGFLIVTLLGVYGCTKGPPGSGTEKNESLEAKVQRLEQDIKSTAAARDQFKQKLIDAEDYQTQLQKKMERERESLKTELKTRLSERDNLASQFDGFRKGLRELLDQAETAISIPSGPTVPSLAAPASTGTPGSKPTEVGSARGN